MWHAATASHRNPLHADFYADHACQTARASRRKRAARSRHVPRAIRMPGNRPADRARAVRDAAAGRLNDPLLGRPLALYDTVLDDQPARRLAIDVVYLTLGKMTRRLAQLRDRARTRRLGPARQWLSAGRHRPPDHGRRRHRPDAVPRARPGVSWDCGKYGDPPRHVPRAEACDALLRRSHGRLAGRRAGLSSGRHSTSASAATTAPSAITAW